MLGIQYSVFFFKVCIHTYDPKDAQDVWGKDDQQVNKGEQSECYGDVAWPVEGLVWEHHLLDGPSYLITGDTT